MLRSLLFVFTVLVMLEGCSGGGGGSDDDRSDAINTASREHIDNTLIPTVQSFAAQIDVMSNDIDTNFCPGADTSSLADLQQQWRDLSETWFKLASYNFGPLDDDLIFPTLNFIDSMRLNGTDYKPNVRAAISGQIGGVQTLDMAFYDALPFTDVGLLALELLIFESSDTNSTSAGDILGEFLMEPRKCLVLQGIIEQLDKHSNNISDGWQIDFDGNGPYRNQFVNRQLPDDEEPMAVLLVAVQFYMDYLHRRNVATRAAQVSDHAYESIGAAIDQVEEIMQGTAGTTVSFYSLMQSAGFGSDVDLINSNIAAARAAIVIEDSISLENAIRALDGHFKREIPNGLNVDPGINFTDGD
ncbi:MAG: imelysin family protein [Pseudomonadota bacterium]